MSSSRSPFLPLVAFGIGAVWLVKYLNFDSKYRPLNDSWGQKINYDHNIAWIAPPTDPKIINQAMGSWRVSERAKMYNAARNGGTYVETPFRLSDWYGGYQN